ncbi:hypothetical protein [Ahrensia kielensis]|uniref:hypothetical protein n=1 Tax=Ahrensia kielensis TaxID=76980 RepID=UPI000361FC2A|nr:hypothetical protein [Ahrensia kielensis]
MNWQAAINLNRDALLRVLGTLLAIVTPHLSRQSRSAILRVLRPAESAARRLIVIAAKIYEKRSKSRLSDDKALPDFTKFARSTKTPVFKLFDPRKRLIEFQKPKQTSKFMPRISVIGVSNPLFYKTKPPRELTTKHLCRRLAALQEALNDLPKQAKRLARQLEKRKTASAGPRRVPPLRPGLPPGYRSNPAHEVDAHLKECHRLALYALEPLT